MASWCDKLSSTPAVGFRFDPMFNSASEFLSHMAPVLNLEMDGDRQTFNMEAIDAFSASFVTDQGFRYAYDHSNLAITFNHRIRAEPSSGGPPTMELISRAAPYTQLLDEVAHKLEQATILLPKTSERQIRRVGIVSLTNVELDDAPPGIVDLFENVKATVGGKVSSFATTITSDISNDRAAADRCVYSLTLPEPPKKLAAVQFDWQRTFTDPRIISSKSIRDLLSEAKKAALAHFEAIAVGGLQDGDSI